MRQYSSKESNYSRLYRELSYYPPGISYKWRIISKIMSGSEHHSPVGSRLQPVNCWLLIMWYHTEVWDIMELNICCQYLLFDCAELWCVFNGWMSWSVSSPLDLTAEYVSSPGCCTCVMWVISLEMPLSLLSPAPGVEPRVRANVIVKAEWWRKPRTLLCSGSFL